ncbi:MAG: Zn-dependent hydrolase [Desulfobacterales bacterium]|nr:Zn-dependent hydrolase [Desulfobacterales bacterium]
MALETCTIDGDRLNFELAELGKIGLGEEGGYYREAFSQADMDGRALVEVYMKEAGMAVTRDAALNSVGRYEGQDESLPPIVIGSHTDTVPRGGNYDGALGVLSGIAVVRALFLAGVRLKHAVEIINFTGEEAVAPGGTFGSRVMTKHFNEELLEQTVYTGDTFREHLEKAGVIIEKLAAAERLQGSAAGYVELHIEQGGILDEENISIGVVSGIVGFRRYRLVFPGTANHAGTTPMDKRDDALIKAARFTLAVKETAERHGIVGTVGTLQVDPGAPNVIPGSVEITFEMRGLDDSVIDAAQKELKSSADELKASFDKYSHKPSVISSTEIVGALEEGCRKAGLDYIVMPSGAGHDANLMARICPVAMLFVPNRDGISHSKDEYATPEACVNGARALLHGIIELDKQI